MVKATMVTHQLLAPPQAATRQAVHPPRGCLLPLQAKLTVGPVNDPLEREADQVAREVVERPQGETTPARCACGGIPGPDGECAACRAKRLAGAGAGVLRRAAGPAAPAMVGAPASVQTALSGPGRALDSATRGFFERRMGADFRSVRVHDGAAADASARAVTAHAYTVGSDIVFARGRYAPGNRDGRELLAHELVHVLQQRDGPGRSSLLQRKPDDCDPGQTEVTITAQHDLTGNDFFVESVMRGRKVSRPIAEKLVRARDVVDCVIPACDAGLRAGETVTFCYGPPSPAPKKPPPPKLPPLVETALNGPRVGRFIRAGEQRRRLKLLDTTRAGDFDAILAIHHILLGLNEDDLTCYWRWVAGGGAVVEGWVNIAGSLSNFMSVRDAFCHPVDVNIQGPLAGSESEYALIKRYDELVAQLPEAMKRYPLEAAAALARGEAAPPDPATALTAARAARDKALSDLGFADVDAYLEAANTFRVQFRDRAVALLIHELDGARAVLVDALSRYQIGSDPNIVLRHQIPPACQELYDEYRAAPNKEVLEARHPILRGTGVWEEISRAADVYDFANRLALYALQRRVDVDQVAWHVNDDPDIVFKFGPVVAEVSKQFGIGEGSIFDLVIREQIGKPGQPWWKTAIDIGLLVLSFVPGPIGFAARLVNSARHVGGEIEDYGVKLAAYQAGVITDRPSAIHIAYAIGEEALPQIGFSVAGKFYRTYKEARAASAVARSLESEAAQAESKVITTAADTPPPATSADVPVSEPAVKPKVTPTGEPTTPGQQPAPAPRPEKTAVTTEPPPQPERAPAAGEPTPPQPDLAPPSVQAAPVPSPRDAKILAQEKVVADKVTAKRLADDALTDADSAIADKEAEVARLADERKQLADKLADADREVEKGVRGSKGAAKRAGVEARKAARALKKAEGELQDLKDARPRLVNRAKARADELKTSEDHLERMKKSSSTEAPRQRPDQPFSPANRRPNNSDFPHVPPAEIERLPELPPGDPRGGLRTNPNARVVVLKERPVSRVRQAHDDILSRLRPGNEQALGHEYEEVIGEDLAEGGGDLRLITQAGDKKRISDLGVHEFTIEKELSDGKLDQLWRDLQTPNVGGTQAANRILLTVPKLTQDSADRLAKMAAIYERLTGRRPHIFVRETAL